MLLYVNKPAIFIKAIKYKYKYPSKLDKLLIAWHIFWRMLFHLNIISVIILYQ